MCSVCRIDDINSSIEFIKIYEKCKGFTMTSIERMYALYRSCQYIVNHNIQGDFVECGVWKGGSTMLIASALLELKEVRRKIYLYDTFEGMSEPTKMDYSIVNKNDHAIDRWKEEEEIDHNKWCFSPLSEVRKNMLSTGYPESNTVFVKGKVENTIPQIMPEKIALLRLDTDWYESTKHELNHLFPVLEKNGVLIIDDYGHWAGSKKAVDEYFSNKPIFLNRIDYTGRLGIKIN